jgi:hypothetical protein
MDHSKSAKENLVRLWGGAYFAGPKEPRDLNKILNMRQMGEDHRSEQVREEVNERMRSRRRNRE